ncbi:MAG: 2-amino-4-hydroxy-6-hydroxymethyldihydropteridine diphosphokinase [Gemmataceae bacterium]|nr:2-amino-4-hydroxy-6-hydroxymethyldihydropteridine diphosphokinase [Gemmataceae bacterium]
MAVIAYLALGSNVGDRAATLAAALRALADADERIQVVRVSTWHETDPVGGPAGQGKYLNAAAAVHTTLDPLALLARLQEIEQAFGRVRTVRDGPRTLDLDILLFGDQIVAHREPGRTLLVPHPRLQERLFVLEPLAEIAADVVHPIFQATIATLLAEARQRLARRREACPGRELSGQRVLITGSTSGIGRAIALELAAAGADVIVHGRRSAARAEEVRRECQALGVRSVALLADLRQEAACAALAHQAWQVWQGLDVVVANAGADTLTGEAADWSFAEKLQLLWEVDIRATVALCRDLGQRLYDRGDGCLVTMGWDQAATGMDGASGQLFAVAKGAVMAFTLSLAATLAPHVRVNALAPGWIKTAWGETASAVWQERACREALLGRWGTPRDVATVARWLIGPNAAFVTGQVIRINGGAVRG